MKVNGTAVEQGLEINHIPFVLDKSQGDFGVLRGHVGKANPVWQHLNAQRESIVVFQGPEAYITPSWYPSKQEHGKVVPTWNYVVVHAHGIAHTTTDETWLIEQLNLLTDQQELSQDEPWRVADAPQKYIDKMLNAIVGIEIPIDKLVGAWKASQNKSAADKSGVVTGLNTMGDASATKMASIICSHL